MKQILLSLLVGLLGFSPFVLAQSVETHLLVHHQNLDQNKVLVYDSSFVLTHQNELEAVLSALHLDAPGPNQSLEKTVRYEELETDRPYPYMGVQIHSHESGIGIEIQRVMEHTPAARAGLQAGDVLMSLDGFLLGDLSPFMDKMAEYKVGELVSLSYEREGVANEVGLRLIMHPNPPESHRAFRKRRVEISKAFLGVQIETAEEGGAKVLEILKPQAEKAGLQVDDVIYQMGKTEVPGMAELVSEIRSHEPGDRVRIYYRRNGKTKRSWATLGERKVIEFIMEPKRSKVEVEILIRELPEQPAEVSDDFFSVPAPQTYLFLGQFQLFPNPSSGQFEVSFETPEQGEIQLEIFSPTGQAIYRETLDGMEQELIRRQLNLGPELARGLYVLRIQQAGMVRVEKVLLN